MTMVEGGDPAAMALGARDDGCVGITKGQISISLDKFKHSIDVSVSAMQRIDTTLNIFEKELQC